jgi:pimeloyl-ACP methyl ester carboxylesterase
MATKKSRDYICCATLSRSVRAMLPGRPRRARRRILIGLGLIGLALPVAGAIYQSQSVAREGARFPAPGAFADVGGRRLHYICTGEGEPAVIFEASGLASSMSFDAVRAEISPRAKTCAYDRMGMGWSDPGPAVISAGMLADDLHALLAHAAIKPPYVLVAASVGGLTAELFARRHPAEIAGLVFVDAADSGALTVAAAIPGAALLHDKLRQTVCLAPMAARLGLVRLVDPLHLRSKGTAGAARTAALIYRPEPLATLCGLQRGRAATMQEMSAAPPLPDVPMVVLTHDRPEDFLPPIVPLDLSRVDPLWRVMQQRLSKRSSHGAWRVVPGSTHLIYASQPHAVVEAIHSVLSQVGNVRGAR